MKTLLLVLTLLLAPFTAEAAEASRTFPQLAVCRVCSEVVEGYLCKMSLVASYKDVTLKTPEKLVVGREYYLFTSHEEWYVLGSVDIVDPVGEGIMVAYGGHDHHGDYHGHQGGEPCWAPPCRRPPHYTPPCHTAPYRIPPCYVYTPPGIYIRGPQSHFHFRWDW